MLNIKVLCHSCIKIEGEKIIYIDPYNIKENYNDADYIFCTHPHYDHLSKEDIKKVLKANTKIVIPKSAENELRNNIEIKDIITVEPNKSYKIENINFNTTYAYNINKQYHPKENKWVGYNIEFEKLKLYIAGDTDNIPEIQEIKCDIAFLPIGGKYTMDYKEAAELANTIDSKIVVPIHYGEIVGKKEDAEKFANLVKNKEVKILLKK